MLTETGVALPYPVITGPFPVSNDQTTQITDKSGDDTCRESGNCLAQRPLIESL